MSDREKAAEYSIAAVSKLTGIGCHALRVWERRYGFPRPERSASGHRRYGSDTVRILVAVSREIREGATIGDLMARVRDGTLDLEVAPAEPVGSGFASSGLLDRLGEGDLPAAEEEYRRATQGLAPVDCVRRVIEPGLVEAGERWFRGDCEIYQEHFISNFLRRKLQILVDEAQRVNASPTGSVLVGTVQGDRHEGGVLMLCLLLETAGWRAISLGVDLPTREIQKAVEAIRPDAVCISFALSRNINKRFDELGKVHGAPVFVGGRSLVNYQGLARRRGLKPVIGPGPSAVAQMIEQVKSDRGTQPVL